MEAIYQHFRKEEKSFIDQVFQWKIAVTDYYAPKLTYFLDPREQMIVQSIIGKNGDVSLQLWGGNETVERKRAILYPSYYEVTDDDFELQCFQLTYPSKFITLTHRDVLGALMSLGIKRDKFGDILVRDDIIQFVVASEVANYVLVNLTSIGQAKIKLNTISPNELFEVEDVWDEKVITVSSLRLDVIIAEIYHISRSKAALVIEQKYVKVNWKVVDEASFQVTEHDYISVRKFGRSKLISIEGNTKKGKIRVKIGIKK